MSCDAFADAVVDLARGGQLGVGSAAAVESHLEHCARCRARFVREAQLTAGLRALATSTGAEEPSAAAGRRLLEAFAEHHSAAATPPAVRGRRWLAAAAAIVMTAGAVAWWVLSGPSGQRQSPVATAPPPSQATATLPDTAPAVPPANHQPESRLTKPPVRSRGEPVRRAGLRVVRPEGFMTLPAAAGLPDFESGEIVRVEIPIASLPTYGIEIPEGSRGAEVEVDLLMGQDGQPRAIRVVRSLDSAGNGGR